MDKSRKFSKFFKFFLSMALVLTVGFIPTVAKASSTQNFNGDITVYTEMLEYGVWVRRLSAVPQAVQRVVTYNTGYFDQLPEYIDSNMRFVFDFDSSVPINYSNKKLSFIFYSKSQLPQEKGGGTYFFNVYNINSVFAKVTTSDGTVKTVPVGYSSFVYSSGTCRLDVDIIYSEPFSDCEILVEFNFYNAYNFERLVNLGEIFSTDIVFYMGAQNVWSLDNVNVPSVDSPDIVDFPDIDEYLPESGNPFMSVFSKFTSIPFVTTSLFIVTIVGVVSYVLFGRKS